MSEKSKYAEIEDFISPELLEANCHHRKEADAPRYFDDEETQEMKHQLYQLSSWAKNRKELAAAAKSIVEGSGNPADELEVFAAKLTSYKLGEQPMKISNDQAKALVERIDNGYETISSTNYAFDYPEIGRMAYYNAQGFYVYDRPMEANEQTAIFTSMRAVIDKPLTGTND